MLFGLAWYWWLMIGSGGSLLIYFLARIGAFGEGCLDIAEALADGVGDIVSNIDFSSGDSGSSCSSCSGGSSCSSCGGGSSD